MASFAEIRRAAPTIHVFKPASKHEEGGVTILEPTSYDERHEARRYSEGVRKSYTQGDGSRENPYRYLSAAPVSAHYGVVDLWSRFREKPVFIDVNGWLLEVSAEGVTAMDGHFTKLNLSFILGEGDKKMVFKNLQLEIGDFVAFQTHTVPLPEVQAVVINVDGGVLEVLSTILAPFQHSGKFTEDEVEAIILVYPAEVAIPQESRGKNFPKSQKVSFAVKDGTVYQGEVVAAFDGVVVARMNDGRLITSRSLHFLAVT